MGLRPFRVRGAQVQAAKRVMTLKRFENSPLLGDRCLFYRMYVQYMLELPLPPFRSFVATEAPPRGKW